MNGSISPSSSGALTPTPPSPTPPLDVPVRNSSASKERSVDKERSFDLDGQSGGLHAPSKFPIRSKSGVIDTALAHSNHVPHDEELLSPKSIPGKKMQLGKKRSNVSREENSQASSFQIDGADGKRSNSVVRIVDGSAGVVGVDGNGVDGKKR